MNSSQVVLNRQIAKAVNLIQRSKNLEGVVLSFFFVFVPAILYFSVQEYINTSTDIPQVKSANTDNYFQSPTLKLYVSGIDSQAYYVERVIDGDTIEVSKDGAVEKVRMIGIDTPELDHPDNKVKCFANKAKNYSSSKLTNQSVFLIGDSTQAEKDRYGRLLRYVVLKDGEVVNFELIKAGYAYEYTYNTPYQYTDEFKGAMQFAQENNLGLWSNICQ